MLLSRPRFAFFAVVMVWLLVLAALPSAGPASPGAPAVTDRPGVRPEGRCQWCATWNCWYCGPRRYDCCTSGNRGESGTCGTLTGGEYQDWTITGGEAECFTYFPEGDTGPQECETRGGANCTSTIMELPVDASHILIVLRGKPQLGSPERGVLFDVNGGGHVVRVSQPIGTSSGWLVLTSRPDARVDARIEMVGSATRLASGRPSGNAYRALREFDSNSDGMLDGRDALWSRLRVWIDRDRDGQANTNELMTLDGLGVRAFSLSAELEPTSDRHGNRYLHRASVVMTSGARQWSYAVAAAWRPLAGISVGSVSQPCQGVRGISHD
jgi:hypothetical protein